MVEDECESRCCRHGQGIDLAANYSEEGYRKKAHPQEASSFAENADDDSVVSKIGWLDLLMVAGCAVVLGACQIGAVALVVVHARRHFMMRPQVVLPSEPLLG